MLQLHKASSYIKDTNACCSAEEIGLDGISTDKAFCYPLIEGLGKLVLKHLQAAAAQAAIAQELVSTSFFGSHSNL